MIPDPLSSGSAGQPLSAHAFAGRHLSGVTRGVTLDDDVRLRGSTGRRATWMRATCGPSACRARLEPERAVQPEGTDGGHVRASVLVGRREPCRASVVRVSSRRRSRIELLGEGWSSPLVAGRPLPEVDRFHGVPFRGRAAPASVAWIRPAVASRVIRWRTSARCSLHAPGHARWQVRCVTYGVCRAETTSSLMDGTPSKMPDPPLTPAVNGAMCSRSSSISPAARYWLIVVAPPAMATLPEPAAARAWSARTHAVGHEVERGATLHRQRVTLVVGEHEHRSVVRRVLAPPTPPTPGPTRRGRD